MQSWYEPTGPYLTRNAAAYPGPINHLMAETWIRAVAAERLRRSQANFVVRIGRWGNALVATHLQTQRDAAQHVQADTQVSSLENGKLHTGLPRVRHALPLRPKPTTPVDPLYNAATCVGGLVDT